MNKKNNETTSPTPAAIEPTSAHRLPTVAASQALRAAKSQNAATAAARTIRLGLPNLDQSLSLQLHQHQPQLSTPPSLGHGRHPNSVGLIRGQVTEVFGPPGVGRTAIGIQACASALSAGDTVIWVDAAERLVGPRIQDAVQYFLEKNPAEHRAPPALTTEEALKNLKHFDVPSLAHLMALVVYPPSTFPPEKTSLIVIESWHVLLEHAYPRAYTTSSGSTINAKKDASLGLSVSTRRKACISKIATSLARLAATKNIAVLVTMKGVTKLMRGGNGGGESPALILPAIQESEWTDILSIRVTMFRELIPPDHVAKQQKRTGEEDERAEWKTGAPPFARFAHVAHLKMLGSRARDDKRSRWVGSNSSLPPSSGSYISSSENTTPSGAASNSEDDNYENRVFPFEIENEGMIELNIEPVLPSSSQASQQSQNQSWKQSQNQQEAPAAMDTSAGRGILSSSLPPPLTSPTAEITTAKKRVYKEIADSESDEYGSILSLDDLMDDDDFADDVGGGARATSRVLDEAGDSSKEGVSNVSYTGSDDAAAAGNSSSGVGKATSLQSKPYSRPQQPPKQQPQQHQSQRKTLSLDRGGDDLALDMDHNLGFDLYSPPQGLDRRDGKE